MLVLTVLQGPDKGRRLDLPEDEPQLIGRSSEALPLSDRTISRRHAELTPDDRHWFLRDLDSANGSFINGNRVHGRQKLKPGDQIRVGNTILLFGEPVTNKQRHGVRVAKEGEIDAHVEHTVSSDDSMILASPDPDEAAPLQLQALYDLLQVMGSTTDQDELLEKVMDVIFDFIQADRGFILLQESPDERPDPVVVRHRSPTSPSGSAISVSRTIVQYVLRRGKGVLSSNAMTDQRFSGGDSVQQYGIRSAMCVPIKFKDRVFGVIHIDSKMVNYTYTDDQLQLLTAVGVQTGLALANSQMYRERLQRERLAAVGQTVASLSHSIKNIIQGLRGGAEVVELGLRKQNMGVVTNGWGIVARNLERISGLTMNMLVFSKDRLPDLEMANLNSLLDEIVALTQSQFEQKQVMLVTDFEADMPPVPVDPSGIHQAVLNLLQNALEAVEPETGVVSCSCSFDQENQTVRLRVGDNGPGIDPHFRQYLFKPFQSTKGLRGTGLGLAVTKKIIDEHGGEIHLSTSADEGTNFLIELPVTQERVAASAETHGAASHSSAAGPLQAPPTDGE